MMPPRWPPPPPANARWIGSRLPFSRSRSDRPRCSPYRLNLATFGVVVAAQLVHITRFQFLAARRALSQLLHLDAYHAATDVLQRYRQLPDSTCARSWSMDLRGHRLLRKVSCCFSAISSLPAQPCDPIVDMHRLAIVEPCSMSAPAFLAAPTATVQSTEIRTRRT